MLLTHKDGVELLHLLGGSNGGIEGVVNSLLSIAGELDGLELGFDVDVGLDQNHISLFLRKRLFLHCLQV